MAFGLWALSRCEGFNTFDQNHGTMAEPRHVPTKKEKCGIEGCAAEGVRSIAGKKVEKAGLTLSTDPDKNVHLCRAHYREFKKRTKSDRTLDRLGW